MILKSCTIEHFGCLNLLKIDFSGKLNIVNKENGWGKSTLAFFLKAMFYGLDTSKRSFNERERFLPWNGERCGGKLIFEAKGKSYEVTRFFDRKSSKNDEFLLTDLSTDLPSTDFTKNIGEELFHIDSEGFFKTFFITQNSVKYDGINDSISALISDNDEAFDISSYEEADERLKALINSLSDTRKTGEIYRLREECSLVKASLLNKVEVEEHITALKNTIGEARLEREGLKTEIKACNFQKTETYKLLSLKKDREVYDELRADAKMLERELSVRTGFFNGHKPDEKLFDELERRTEEVNELSRKLEKNALTDEETLEFEELKDKFPDGELTEADILRYEEKASLFEKLNDEWETGESKGKSRFNAFLFIGCLGFLFGIYAYASKLFYNFSANPGNILAAVFIAAAVFIFAGILRLKHQGKEEDDESGPIFRLQSEIEEFLQDHNIESDENYGETFEELRAELRRLNYFKDREAKLEALCLQRENSFNRLLNILKVYELTDRIEIITDSVSGGTTVSADSILDVYAEYASILSDLSKAQNRLLQFERTHDVKKLFNLPLDRITLYEAIDKKIDELNSEIDNLDVLLKNDTALLSEEFSKLDDLKEREDRVKELEIEILKKSKYLEHVRQAQSLLEKAYESYSSKYTGPVKEAFLKYCALFLKEEVNHLRFNANMEISSEEMCKLRKIDTLSCGYKDLIGFCMRLALTDVMYRDEKPMLVLDDPFINLDNGKDEGIRYILEELKENYQIIYMTCRDERVF